MYYFYVVIINPFSWAQIRSTHILQRWVSYNKLTELLVINNFCSSKLKPFDQGVVFTERTRKLYHSTFEVQSSKFRILILRVSVIKKGTRFFWAITHGPEIQGISRVWITLCMILNLCDNKQIIVDGVNCTQYVQYTDCYCPDPEPEPVWTETVFGYTAFRYNLIKIERWMHFFF